MFPAALNKVIDKGEMLQPDDCHRTLIGDLRSESISWRIGKDDTLEASIPVADGSDTVLLHIPIETPGDSTDSSAEFGVGYKFTNEDLSGDVRMREETRRILIQAGLQMGCEQSVQRDGVSTDL